MKSSTIAIIDSGISPAVEFYKNVKQEFCVIESNETIEIIEIQAIDSFGHGTAVASIIYQQNPDVSFIVFKICNDVFEVTSQKLIDTLKFIEANVKVDIINISAGLTYYRRLLRIEKHL